MSQEGTIPKPLREKFGTETAGEVLDKVQEMDTQEVQRVEAQTRQLVTQHDQTDR